MLKLKIIIGSTRPGRVGLPVSKWFVQLAKKHTEFAIEVLDLAEVNLPFLDEPNHPMLAQYTKEHTKKWSAKIADGDLYVFITPEYNFGYPATIKNAIDYLHREWKYKPVGFVSYGGVAAGTRSVQLLKPVITAMSMMPIYEAVAIPFIKTHIDESGNFKTDEHIDSSANKMLEKLSIWAKHFKNLREEMIRVESA